MAGKPRKGVGFSFLPDVNGGTLTSLSVEIMWEAWILLYPGVGRSKVPLPPFAGLVLEEASEGQPLNVSGDNIGSSNEVPLPLPGRVVLAATRTSHPE